MKKLFTHLKAYAFAATNLAKRVFKKKVIKPGCEDILFV